MKYDINQNGGHEKRKKDTRPEHASASFITLGKIRKLASTTLMILVATSIFRAHSRISQLEAFKQDNNDDVINFPKSENLENKIVEPSDGTFNGMDVYYRDDSPLHSTSRCVGENYQENSWMYRSCKFHNLCFDMTEKEFVLFRSPNQKKLHDTLQENDFGGFTSHMETNVSIGGINPKWTAQKDGYIQMKWFPKVIDRELTEGHYELSSDVVLVPFHSFAAFNPGHLIWDDFLPIYTLLEMFQLYDGYQPLLLRWLPKARLWASCTVNDEVAAQCKKMFTKFLPLMGVEPVTLSSVEDFRLVTENVRSRYICARQGVGGFGMLTDHGIKLHGWEDKDYKTTHNLGRGPMLYSFRNVMMKNLGLPIEAVNPNPPFTVTFSTLSSKSHRRNLSFENHIVAVRKAFGDKVTVEGYNMAGLSVKEQVKIVSKSAIYVTVCGGGAVTASFLPKDSALILYYEHSLSKKWHGRLDWDALNNAAYMQVHWIAMNTDVAPDITEEAGISRLIQIIEIELGRISQVGR